MLIYFQLIILLNAILFINCNKDYVIKKINNYVGKGYNIYLGNPKSHSSFDPGFQSFIFNITTKTHGSLVLPDNIEFTETGSFKFTATQKEYSGMTKYSQDLSAHVGVEANGLVAKGSFSLNTDFKHTVFPCT